MTTRPSATYMVTCVVGGYWWFGPGLVKTTCPALCRGLCTVTTLGNGNPAPVIFFTAASCRRPATAGSVIADGPAPTKSTTVEPLPAEDPADGSVRMTF